LKVRSVAENLWYRNQIPPVGERSTIAWHPRFTMIGRVSGSELRR
jgi:hypothetical protein